MADVFREVDEELSRERYRALWDRYWIYGAAIISLLLAIVAVREFSSWRETVAGDRASRAYVDGLDAMAEGRVDDARAQFGELAQDGPGGYRMLARAHEAAAALAEGEDLQAAASFEQAAQLARSPLMRDLYQLQAAYARADQLSADELRMLVEPLAEPGRPFALAARELLATSLFAGGDYDAARDEYRALLLDPLMTPQMRSRIDQALALIRAEAPAATPASNDADEASAEDAETTTDTTADDADEETQEDTDE